MRCPKCGSLNLICMDGLGATTKYGAQVLIDIAPNMWLCEKCKRSFSYEEVQTENKLIQIQDVIGEAGSPEAIYIYHAPLQEGRIDLGENHIHYFYIEENNDDNLILTLYRQDESVIRRWKENKKSGIYFYPYSTEGHKYTINIRNMRSITKGICNDLKKLEEEMMSNCQCYQNDIFGMKQRLYNILPNMYMEAINEAEKSFVKTCEERLLQYYQQALKNNYQKIEKQKEIGVISAEAMSTWAITIDETGQAIKTSVIGVNTLGYPLYDGDYQLVSIRDTIQKIYNYRYELRHWLELNDNLTEFKEAALKLKQISLGKENIPNTNYDLDGLTREQRDAQAWQNYVIESGMYQITDYDKTLDQLLVLLEQCIDFYQQAISMV